MDGCGKSTQLRRLAERLTAAGRTVVENAEPGGTSIGRQIRQILLDPENTALSAHCEILLYFANRAQNVDETIRPALAAGAIVLSDRFTDASMAYQGYGRALGAETVEALDRIACREVRPSLTIYLDVDLETSLARARTSKHADRMERLDGAFYDRVREAYRRIAGAEPERVRVVDGRGSIEEVGERVWEVALKYV